TTKAGPEPRPKKPKAETHVVPSKKERTKDPEATDDEEDAESESRKSTPPKAPAKPVDTTPAKCETHHAPGAERHTCGAWRCNACLEAATACPSRHPPVPTPSHGAIRAEVDADMFQALLVPLDADRVTLHSPGEQRVRLLVDGDQRRIDPLRGGEPIRAEEDQEQFVEGHLVDVFVQRDVGLDDPRL